MTPPVVQWRPKHGDNRRRFVHVQATIGLAEDRSDRGPQLMGGLGRETGFAFDRFGQAIERRVECYPQLSQFVVRASVRRQAFSEVAGIDTAGRERHFCITATTRAGTPQRHPVP